MSVKTRITLLIAGAGLFASLLFSVVVFLELLEQPFKIIDDVLREEGYRTVATIVKRQSRAELASVYSSAHSNTPYWIEVLGQGPKGIAYRSSLAKLVSLPQVEVGDAAIATVIVPRKGNGPGEKRGEKVTFRIKAFSFTLGGKTFLVRIARPIEKLEDEIRDLVLSIGAGLVLSCAALVLVSRFLAGKILKPIGEMKELAREISERNLDGRIPVGRGKDEFNELARTINWMLERLQNSFIRQRNFLFDTSHELKTPLTSMRLAIDEVCASDVDRLQPLARDNLFQLKNQVLRMERLVKDLLNLSSLETLTRIDAEPVDITGLLSSLVADYRLLANAQDVQMETQLGGGLVVRGDAERLKRAFSNILDNAIKFNVEGGRVDVIGKESDGLLIVTVTNTGPGLAAEKIDKVFDQFYRAERSRSLQHGGAGLGLSIVKRIVELHRGKISIESKKDAWTRVAVSLPQD